MVHAELVKVVYNTVSIFNKQRYEVLCTPDHKFLVKVSDDNEQWIEAKNLERDMKLVSEDHKIIVESVENTDRREDVYCLTVEDTHTFLIEGSVVVHNCGMRAVKLADKHLDLPNLDNVIRKYVPSGFEIHDEAIASSRVADILAPVNVDKAFKSLGTLGGGNHFIEIDTDKNGDYWLVIHTGSRHLGIEVCDYYQNFAYENLKLKEHNGKTIQELSRELVDEYTKAGKQKEISKALTKLRNDYKATHVAVPFELAYLEGQAMQDYLHDMKLAQEHAKINRETIAKQILKYAKLTPVESFDTIHNYIDVDNMILRKGSISAQAGEKVIIPMNMRDGSLICVGKGNADWNYSAPHGAGRILSRSKAKDTISMTEYQESMKGIYTTSVNKGTIDEIQDKYEWIKEYLPFISDDNIFFCPLGVDKTKFVKGNAEKSILIDDYNLNLEAWDKNGGVAIKAINSINTPTERFVHINVRDKEKWLKSQMESSGDEQIEKLKTKIIEMQIKNWIKADTEFIKQVLNINERCD